MNNSQNDMTSTLEGLINQQDITIKRLNTLRREFAIQSDPNQRFTLNEKINEIEKDLETIKHKIQTENTNVELPKNQEFRVQNNSPIFINDFIDKWYLCRKFIANDELGPAIHTAMQLSSEFQDELLMEDLRLNSHLKAFKNVLIDYNGLMHKKSEVAKALIKILNSLQDLYNKNNP